MTDMNKPAIAFGFIAMLAALIWGVQLEGERELRERLEELRVRTGELRSVGKPVDVTLRPKVGPDEPARAGIVLPAQADTGLREGLSEQVYLQREEDYRRRVTQPEFHAAQLVKYRTMVRSLYADLPDWLDIPRPLFNQYLDMGARQMQEHVTETSLSAERDPEKSGAILARHESEIRELLGESLYLQYQEYRALRRSRGLVRQLNQLLPPDQALDRAGLRRAALTIDRVERQFIPPGAQRVRQSASERRQMYENMRKVLAPLLTVDQLRIWQEIREGELAQAQMAEMRRP